MTLLFILFFLFTMVFLILLIKKIATPLFYKIVLRVFFSFFISFMVFYFFDTPFLWESALAEEISDSVKADAEKPEVQKELEVKKEETSWFSSVKTFLWNYKWPLIVGLSFIIFVSYVILVVGDPSMAAQMRGIATDPNLPATSQDIRYFEEFPKNTFTRSATFSKGLPENFVAANNEVHHLKDIYLHSAIVVAPETLNPQTGDLAGPLFRVYPCKPILNSVSSISTESSRVFVEAYNASTCGNSYGWSSDPSVAHWVKEANLRFPHVIGKHFEVSDPNIILSYQKVALVEPHNLNATLYHRVSIHTITDTEFDAAHETVFKGANLKSVFMKDNETGWIQ